MSRPMSMWGIIVAGGSGARFGGLKQLAVLGDSRVIDRSIRCLSGLCDGLVAVVPPDLVASAELAPEVRVVAGDVTRSGSVRAGLAAVGPEATHVLVHDAARPLATEVLAGRVATALGEGAKGVVPVVPVTDSLRRAGGSAVDRDGFVAVQTPQGFALDVLRRAHATGTAASDDATLLDRLGIEVVQVEGEATNFKITEPHQLRMAQAVLDGC